MKTKTLLIASILSSAIAAQGALITWNGNGDGVSWSDGSNWVGGSGPSNNDTFSISNTTVNYDVSGLTLGVRSTLNNATLNLTASNIINIPGSNTTDPINMLNGSYFNITGGTHTIAGRISYNSGPTQGGGINIVGSSARLNTAQLINWNPTLSFEFDATGVGFINYGSYFAANSASLYVDGSAYFDAYTGPYVSGGTQFNLINTANLLGQEIDSSNINIVGLGQEGNTNYGYILTQDAGTADIFLTVFIPEPSSSAMLGLGLSSLLLRRRRS